jgi:predicted Zn finger-like uncharacterized protein
MVSPLASTVVIECPHCGTRYQLPAEAVGAKGREVACAHCGKTWHAKPLPRSGDDPDTLFDEASERALDEAFKAQERAAAEPQAAKPPAAPPEDGERMRSIAEIKAAISPRQRPETPGNGQASDAGDRRRQKAFDKRQAALSRQSPLARVRRIARVASVSALLAVVVGAIAFRTEIVRQLPDLAGIYESIGLGVNIVGLEFRDVTTLTAWRAGAEVMQVDARIYSVGSRTIAVPPVVVTLLDANGSSLYEWSVVPDARNLDPGEVVDFATQLTTPPPGAASVRLTFTDGKARTESSLAAAPAGP